jgi:hypothetical protein
MTMHALLVQRSDHAFDRVVLLGALRHDELPSKPVAACHSGVNPRRGDQPVVLPQQERPVDAPEATEACAQRLL